MCRCPAGQEAAHPAMWPRAAAFVTHGRIYFVLYITSAVWCFRAVCNCMNYSSLLGLGIIGTGGVERVKGD